MTRMSTCLPARQTARCHSMLNAGILIPVVSFELLLGLLGALFPDVLLEAYHITQ